MARIATEAELEEFQRLPDSQKKVTDSIRGVLAETALTGVIRYGWPLLRPVIVYLMDQVLRDYEAETALEVGPPRPLPNDETLAQMIDRLRGYLLEFRDAPWTLQRICELLLEPHKQYTKLHKVALAIEKLLLVTSEQEPSKQPPEPPQLSQLGPVNEVPPRAAAAAATGAAAAAAASRKRRWGEGEPPGQDTGALMISAINSTAAAPRELLEEAAPGSWQAEAAAAAAAGAGAASQQARNGPAEPEAAGGAAGGVAAAERQEGTGGAEPMQTDSPSGASTAAAAAADGQQQADGARQGEAPRAAAASTGSVPAAAAAVADADAASPGQGLTGARQEQPSEQQQQQQQTAVQDAMQC